MKAIVGLGNIGKEYEHTRHNVGFMALQKTASRYDFESFHLEEKFESEISAGMIDGEKVVLIKPQTYMNASGRATSKVLNFYKIEIQDLIVIHDDLDIPLGELRVSIGSRSAGHKGVQSIIDCLNSQNFKRMRIGIKIEDRKIPTEKFVLGVFSKEENEKINSIIDTIPEAIEKELI